MSNQYQIRKTWKSDEASESEVERGLLRRTITGGISWQATLDKLGYVVKENKTDNGNRIIDITHANGTIVHL